jgi:hypothetical protein
LGRIGQKIKIATGPGAAFGQHCKSPAALDQVFYHGPRHCAVMGWGRIGITSKAQEYQAVVMPAFKVIQIRSEPVNSILPGKALPVETVSRNLCGPRHVTVSAAMNTAGIKIN